MVPTYACVSSSVLPGEQTGGKGEEGEAGEKDHRDCGPYDAFA